MVFTDFREPSARSDSTNGGALGEGVGKRFCRRWEREGLAVAVREECPKCSRDHALRSANTELLVRAKAFERIQGDEEFDRFGELVVELADFWKPANKIHSLTLDRETVVLLQEFRPPALYRVGPPVGCCDLTNSDPVLDEPTDSLVEGAGLFGVDEEGLYTAQEPFIHRDK